MRQQQPSCGLSKSGLQCGGHGLQQVSWRNLDKGTALSELPKAHVITVGMPWGPTVVRKVIKLQRQRFPQLQWIRADARRMPRFKNKSFDVVIEKALNLGVV